MIDLDCLVVLLWVLLEKKLVEICISSALYIEIIGYTPGNLVLVGTIGLAARPLEGGVAITNAVLTYTACKLSAAFCFSL